MLFIISHAGIFLATPSSKEQEKEVTAHSPAQQAMKGPLRQNVKVYARRQIFYAV